MRKRHNGFTLIELMVVVAIVGILAAVAFPSYQEHIRKGRRSDAKSALMTAAQAMERYYTENGKYNDASLDSSVSGFISSNLSPEGFYSIQFDGNPGSGTVCDPAAFTLTSPNAASFRLCAIPQGVQASDTCGVFSITSAGVKLAKLGTTTKEGCW